MDTIDVLQYDISDMPTPTKVIYYFVNGPPYGINFNFYYN